VVRYGADAATTARRKLATVAGNAFLRAVPVLVVGNLNLVVSTFAPESWTADIFSRGRWHANIWQVIGLLWICLDIMGALLTGARRSLHDMLGSTLVMPRPNQAMQRTPNAFGVADLESS